MTDLYDRAKPARDAIVKQIEEMCGTKVRKERAEAMKLGAHFVALLAGYTSERHKLIVGVVDDGDLIAIMTQAFGILLSNAASVYRPVVDNRPIHAMGNLIGMLQMTVMAAQEQIIAGESGMSDIAVPFALDDTGHLGIEEFDLRDMLKGPGNV